MDNLRGKSVAVLELASLEPPIQERNPMRNSKRVGLAISALFGIAAIALAGLAFAPSANQVEVLRARVNIVEGQPLNASAFESISVSTQHADAYLNRIPSGAMALHSIFQGELLPRSRVSQSPNLNRVKVTIEPARLPVSVLEPGESVELWAVTRRQAMADSQPHSPVRLISPAATILEKSASSAGFAAADNGLDVLVSRADLPLILEAIASPDTELVLVRNPSV